MAVQMETHAAFVNCFCTCSMKKRLNSLLIAHRVYDVHLSLITHRSGFWQDLKSVWDSPPRKSVCHAMEEGAGVLIAWFSLSFLYKKEPSV